MNIEKIKRLKEAIKRNEDIYNNKYENEDAMANNLLDYAETIMRFQATLISELEK